MFAKNFRVNAVMKTSVLLSWEVPDSYKSAVPFKVRVGCRGWGALPVAVGRAVESSILICHMMFSAIRQEASRAGSRCSLAWGLVELRTPSPGSIAALAFEHLYVNHGTQ